MDNKASRDAFGHFVEDLRSTHRDNLASVVLYGAAAAGDQIRLRSDYNLLVALHRITAEDLRSAQAPMREWQRLGQSISQWRNCVMRPTTSRSKFTRCSGRAPSSRGTTRLRRCKSRMQTCDIKRNTSCGAS